MGSTTKFGWPYPDPSDLVRDAPEAFEDLADAIETTLSGTILQVVSVTKTDVFSTSSTSFVDVTGLAATITPSKNTHKVLVLVTTNMGASNSLQRLNLVRGSTTIAQPAGGTSPSTSLLNATSNVAHVPAHFAFLDSPTSATAVTYKIQTATSSGTAYVNSSRDDSTNRTSISTITLMEVAA